MNATTDHRYCMQNLEPEELLAAQTTTAQRRASLLSIAQRAVQARAARDHDEALKLLQFVAEHPDAPTQALMIAAAHPDAALRRTVIGRDGCPSQALEAAFARSEEEVRSAHAAARRYRGRISARSTYEIEDPIRAAIASAPACSTSLLGRLVETKNAKVRLAVASHPSTPLAALETLLAISKTARPQHVRGYSVDTYGAQICDEDGAIGYAEVTEAILAHPTYRAAQQQHDGAFIVVRDEERAS